MLRTAQAKAPRKTGQRSARQYLGRVHRQRQGRPTALRLPSGKEMAGAGSSMNCIYSFTDPDDRTGRCGDDRRVILPPLPRQGSRIPSYAGARIRGIRLGPLRWEQKGRTSHSPDYSVLGRTLGQVTHGPPGPSIRPENALGWDMVSVGGRMGPRSKRAASACPTGQHPNLRLRGSWLRHGGWATPCCRRPEMSRDPDPLRMCG